MRFTKFAAGVLAATTMALSLTACGSSDSGGGENVLRVWGGEPQNPLVTTNTNETGGSDVLKNIYDGLVTVDDNGKVVNEIADKIEPNADNTEFRITLKGDRTFHDGTPVDANSFVDAWNFGAAAKNAQKGQSFFETIKGYDEVSKDGSTSDKMSGLKVVSPTEFTVTLSAPEADFPNRLVHYVYFPLPKVAFTDIKAFGEHPVGNGPYKLESDTAWTHEVGVKTVKNPDYKGSRTPANDGLDFVFYNSLDTAYADVQSGALDTIGYTVPPSALGTFQQDFPDSHANQPQATLQLFSIPFRLAHFGNDEEGKLRRQAISMSVNRQQITEKIFHGTRTPATDFTTPAVEGFTPDLPGNSTLKHDPAKAKELWKKADEITPFSGTFEIAYNADGGHQPWVDAVSNDIKNTLGIQAQGKSYPTFKQIRTEAQNKTIPTAFRTGWQADYPSRYNFLDQKYKTGAGSNDSGYSSKKFDDAVVKAAATKGDDAFQKAINDAQAPLFEDLPEVPLWYPNASTVWNPKLKNVKVNYEGYPVYYKISKN